MEIIELLKEAEAQILRLRRTNEILSAKMEVFDSLICVLHTAPASRSQGAEEDIAWRLRQTITGMELRATAAEKAPEQCP